MRRAILLAWLVVALALGERPVAAAGDVVAIVSAKSEVAGLSRSQVADIFLGKTSRFPDGAKAVPLDQPEGSAARDEFYEKFTGKSPPQVKAHWAKIIFTGRGAPPPTASSSEEVRKRVAKDPSAIAYLERSAIDGSVRIVSQ